MTKNKTFIIMMAAMFCLVAAPAYAFDMTQWANVFRITVNESTQPLSNQFIYVNGSSGFTINGVTQYIKTIGKQNDTFFFAWNSSTIYTIVNASKEPVPFCVEVGTGPSMNCSQIYQTGIAPLIDLGMTSVNSSTGDIGAITNTATLNQSGIFGNARNMTAGTSEFSIADNLSWGLPQFSISFWVSHNVIQSGFGGGQEDAGASFIFARPISAVYRFAIRNGTSGVSSQCDGGSTTAGPWYMITGTYNGTAASAHKLYVNKANPGNCTFSGTVPDVDAPFEIGHNTAGGQQINASIDQFYFYPRALTQEEINFQYDQLAGNIFSVFNVTPGIPIVTVTDPENRTYAITNMSLNASSNQDSPSWFYELNGAANVSFSAPGTTFTASQGTNTIKVFANASGFIGNRTVVFTVDTTAPTITIDQPQNKTYTSSNVTVAVNYTEVRPSFFWYNLNSGPRVFFSPNTTLTGVEGFNNLTVAMNDTAGNVASYSVNFTVNTLEISILDPANRTYTSTSIRLNVTANMSISTWRYILNSGSQQTFTPNTTITAVEGFNNLTVFATSSSGTSASKQVNFTVDTTAPTITILAPGNTTYLRRNITLNVTANEVIDKWFYELNGLPNITFTPNTTFLTRYGSNRIKIFANDTAGNMGDPPTFFWVSGVNISTFLPNGTAIRSWNVTITNSSASYSVVGQNNSLLIDAADIPQGNATFNVTNSSGVYDTDVWNVNMSFSSVQQHNFTIYPLSYFYFYDNTAGIYLTSWTLTINNTVQYFTTTAGTQFSISNRNLTSGANIATGSKTGYLTNSTSFTLDNSTSSNITINARQTLAYMWAWDELTRVKKGWNAQLTLVGSNSTAVYVSAYRNGTACLYDGDTSTNCIVGSGEASYTCANSTTIQAFDWNNATFNLTFQFASGAVGPSSYGDVNIYLKNGTRVFTHHVTTNGTYSDFVPVQNDNNQLGTKAPNLTVEGCAVSGSIGNPSATRIREFILHNNTAQYSYVDDNTVTIPALLLTNFGQAIITFRGEADYQTDYTVARNYIVQASTMADFNIVGYLLRDSGDGGYFQTFSILNANNQPIPGAVMTIGRWYSSVEATIAQCLTPASGQCILWLQNNQPLYSTRVVTSGYNTYYNQSSVYQSGQGTAYIYLTSTGTISFASPFDTLSVDILANGTTNQYFMNSINTTCTSTAPGNLNSINFTAYRTQAFNDSIFYNSAASSSSPSGTTLQIEVRDNGQFQLRCTYEWVSNATGNSTVYRSAKFVTIWVYSDSLSGAGTGGGFDNGLGIIISLGIILVICAPISLVSPGYAAAIGIFLLLMFAFVGLIPATTMIMGNAVSGWYIAALAIITAIALMFLRSFL